MFACVCVCMFVLYDGCQQTNSQFITMPMYARWSDWLGLLCSRLNNNMKRLFVNVRFVYCARTYASIRDVVLSTIVLLFIYLLLCKSGTGATISMSIRCRRYIVIVVYSFYLFSAILISLFCLAYKRDGYRFWIFRCTMKNETARANKLGKYGSKVSIFKNKKKTVMRHNWPLAYCKQEKKAIIVCSYG